MLSNENPSSDYIPEQQVKLQAKYSFIFCYHTPPFASAIAEAVQDSDTIALELHGFDSNEVRAAWGGLMTRFVASDTTDYDKTWMRANIEQNMGSSYIGPVLDQLQGTDKRIALIDIDTDNPGYSTVENYYLANNKFYEELDDGSLSIEIMSSTRQYLQAAHECFQARDPVMAQQLKDLGGTEGKIAVVTGIIHTPIKDALSAIAQTESITIGPKKEIVNGTEHTHYMHFDQALQQMHDMNEIGISEQTVKRIVLESTVDSYGAWGNVDEPELAEILTIDQVTALIAEIDTIKMKYIGMKKNKFRGMMSQSECIESIKRARLSVGLKNDITPTAVSVRKVTIDHM